MDTKNFNGNKNIAAATRNVCVYCGSGLGLNPSYAEAARTLGANLAVSRSYTRRAQQCQHQEKTHTRHRRLSAPVSPRSNRRVTPRLWRFLECRLA